MKMLVVGDLHFKANNLLEGKLLADSIIKIAANSKITSVVFLGDSLDNHATIHSQAFNLIYYLLHNLPVTLHKYILIGNHDYINNSQFCTNEHPFNSFKCWSNVNIVDNLFLVEDLCFVPFVPTGRFKELQIPKETKIIFAHQEFRGAVKEDAGDVWPEDYPLIISGHIHRQCWLQKNIFYPGSPVQHSFAEEPNKTVMLLDTETLDMQFVSLDLPKKYTFEIDLEEVDNFNFPVGNVRLKIKCNAASWAVFKKSKKYKELTANKIKIIPLAVMEDFYLKKMAKKRTTYIEALTTYANNSGGHVLDAFNEVMANENNI